VAQRSACSAHPFDLPPLTGTQVFWHSSAHVLGEAMELHMGGCLCYGPPIDQGFYYDTFLEGK
jgi:threonyl-tRNA synthetase